MNKLPRKTFPLVLTALATSTAHYAMAVEPTSGGRLYDNAIVERGDFSHSIGYLSFRKDCSYPLRIYYAIPFWQTF